MLSEHISCLREGWLRTEADDRRGISMARVKRFEHRGNGSAACCAHPSGRARFPTLCTMAYGGGVRLTAAGSHGAQLTVPLNRSGGSETHESPQGLTGAHKDSRSAIFEGPEGTLEDALRTMSNYSSDLKAKVQCPTIPLVRLSLYAGIVRHSIYPQVDRLDDIYFMQKDLTKGWNS